jgi:methylated-DNA-protein-cysteine methyltransferase-like protein
VSPKKKPAARPKPGRFAKPKNFYEAVYRVVILIPRGRVMTYGQIATILGAPRASRAVGYAMRACPDGIPWQRVINGKGQISARTEVERPILQQMMLQREGIRFDKTGTCDLDRLRWEPADPERFYFQGADRMPFD